MARLRFSGKLDGSTYDGMPVSGRVTSFYGVVRPELSQGKGHSGVDIAAVEGTPILAPMDGVINDVFTTEETVAWRKNVAAIFGNSVFLRHNDSDGNLIGYTLYAHCHSAPSLSRSESVKQGDLLGVVGSTGQSTGPHLHWGCTVSNNPYFSRSKGLNDAFKFLETDTESISTKQANYDEQQANANDLIDSGQSIMNDLIDTLQGKVEDMGGN
jgi:murein DD-endopeptidase MepM/ murein hydrolase activator NlpD